METTGVEIIGPMQVFGEDESGQAVDPYSPEHVAPLVAYLASPAGDFFSGTTITIDGARDNWAGPWPPEAIAGEGGKPVAEERRPKD